MNEATVNLYSRDVRATKTLDHEQMLVLFDQMHNGTPSQSQAAKKAIVEGNLRLVLKHVSKLRLHGSQLEDAIQDGNQGLIRAVEKFEPARGLRFSTYACNWISVMVRDGLDASSNIVHVPTSVQRTNMRLFKAQSKAESGGERQLSIGELSRQTGDKPEDVHLYLRLKQSNVPLDAHINGESGSDSIKDTIADERSNLESADHEMLMSKILDRVKQLPIHQRNAIIRHYGLDGGDGETLNAIGDEYGLTRERIRQIIKDGVEKICFSLKDERRLLEAL